MKKNIVETKIIENGNKLVVIKINRGFRKTTYAPSYEDLREAIAQLGLLYGKEEVIRELGLEETTNFPEPEDRRIIITLTQLMRRNLEKENIEKIIEDGFLLMKHKYEKNIREIEDLKTDLILKTNITKKLTNNFKIIDVKFTINEKKPATKTVVIRRRLQAGINTMAERLGIEMSSMIRLCIYHSLAVGDESIISREMIEESKSQLKKFKYDLIEAKVVLMGFEYSEDLWREKKNDWLDELNNIDKIDDVELEFEDE